jgi:HEPN domain-containing protein
MLPLEGVTDAIVGFGARQAVEKSLKAVLAACGVEFLSAYDIGAPRGSLRGGGSEPAG